MHRPVPGIWHRFWPWCIAKLYFEKITIIHSERIPQEGPVIYLGLHRNGAVDGFVYSGAVSSQTVFMISSQLRKNVLGRIFFNGIEVARNRQEGSDEDNSAALRNCLKLLSENGALFIFPEGTSDLGPRHLRFRSGAAQIISESLQSGLLVQVVPLAINYECAWSFRSKVEVYAGNPVKLDLDPSLDQPGRLASLKNSIQYALEEIGINLESAEYQQVAEKLAYVSTLGTSRHYHDSLKLFEKSISPSVLGGWERLGAKFSTRKLLLHQGVPLFPMGNILIYLAFGCLLFPVVLSALIFNAVPYAAGWWAGRRLADAKNVVSLWKILVGFPILFLWGGLVLAICLFLRQLDWFCVYLAITLAGIQLYYRAKKLAVTLYNGLFYASLKPAALKFREDLLHAM